MAEADQAQQDAETAEGALESGNYEVIKSRLTEQGKDLTARLDRLNTRRREVFGGTELAVIEQERIRSENNCVPRDIVNVGGRLLFGYNVFIGLKKETAVSDVFSLFRFGESDGTTHFKAIPHDEGDAFLADPEFVKEFTELYKYYKETRLLQLVVTDTRLLAVFQIGAALEDIKVFRWSVESDGSVRYMDIRGDSDYTFPPSHDFEWTPTTRDNQVQGRYPHLSILDALFVETTDGDLTIKVENNTESGRGVYAEAVDDANQSLDDGQFAYAKVGSLILLKVLPFRELDWRYLVFNTLSQEVTRIDAIGLACRRLPEDHGIIFPGGYYLDTGDRKLFENVMEQLTFKRAIKSPNGEDVLYLFHRPEIGHYSLLPYNVIRKEVQSPIECHGFSLFEDGQMLVFRALSEEPTRVHPMQIWSTPFTSAEFAAEAPTTDSFLAKVGNADLARGISEANDLRRLIVNESPTRHTYESLIKISSRMIDSYFWLDHEEVEKLKGAVIEIKKTAELIVDEFEKVLAMRHRASEALGESVDKQQQLIRDLTIEEPTSVAGYMDALTSLRHQRGHLISLREVRYMDVDSVQKLEDEIVEQFDKVSRRCVEFLLGENALTPLTGQLEELLTRSDEAGRVADIKPVVEELDKVSEGLDVISEVVAGLEVDDATARTQILESISEVFAHLNRVRATVTAKRKELMGSEGRAEFAAQFKLLGQSVSSGLTLSDSPEKCDEHLSRLMVQLEELEARFSDFDEFLGDISKKREELYDAFSSKKQALLDERQRRAESLMGAATRILDGVGRRARNFKEQDDLNAYFASDAMIMKLRQVIEQLRELGDSVKADEAESRLKTARQDAIRGLRDKADLYEEGDLIKLGKHRFTYNTQPLELTMVPRQSSRGSEGMALHLTGTDFYESIEDEEFAKTADFWSQQYVSETDEVYRGEFLAASIVFNAEEGKEGLSIDKLHEAEREEGGLLALVRHYASTRYDEGYERGVHDADATLILEKLVTMRESAGLLRFPPTPRAFACLYWASLEDEDAKSALSLRAKSLGRLRTAFGQSNDLAELGQELALRVDTFLTVEHIEHGEGEASLAGLYLAEELTADDPHFVASVEAERLREQLLQRLDIEGTRRQFEDDLRDLSSSLRARVSLVEAWVEAFVDSSQDEAIRALAPLTTEAATLFLTDTRIARQQSSGLTHVAIEGLLGQHPRIVSRTLELRLDEFLERLSAFRDHRVPGYKAYRQTRHDLLEREKARLRLEEFKPKVMSAFVRNKLINDVYLPLIGDNLAKQLGAAGDSKRTDLMGLLLLISPPGYGKTTLMEYMANRLGQVFMKINGPSLGHAVHSLDPAEAPNATARQEVEKINLAFEMGTNVMLYLDDIQHTHPELLQKFISLCDAQRRIEGVWKGKTRTYDLRGKKFCVVMAGNPYTESGDKFQIPDMLSNRADTYNLGDILEGKDDVFALSYVENSLTSNPTLQPLATRDQGDVYKLVRMAQGEEVPTTDLSYGYSGSEVAEMVEVLKRLFACRDVLLAVNMEYIRSASMEDNYRTEPPFKLQGSYRNMNKLAEKVVSAMNDVEVQNLIDDHYNQESQVLTTGAEMNLLKLAELRGRVDDTQLARWNDIKSEFKRQKSMGGGDDDPVTRVTGTLGMLGEELEAIKSALGSAVERNAELAAQRAQTDQQRFEWEQAAKAEEIRRANEEAERRAHNGNGGIVNALAPHLTRLEQTLAQLARPQLEVTVTAPESVAQQMAPQVTGASAEEIGALVKQQFDVVQSSLMPLVNRANQDLADSKALHEHVMQLLDLIRKVNERLRSQQGG